MMPKSPKENSFSAIDADGKPKRVFQSITICRQYEEYTGLKTKVYSNLKTANCLSLVLLIIGVIFTIYLAISLFVDRLTYPLSLLLG